MGSSASASVLAAKLRSAGNGLQGATREGVREAAIAAKAIFEAEMVGKVGGRRLSGVGRAGAKLGVRFTNPTSNANPTSIVMYTGPAHLANSGTRRHQIRARGTRVGKSGRRLKGGGGMVFPDGEVRPGPVDHPGTPGKDFFDPATKKVSAVVPGFIARAESRELRRVFGA